MITSSNKVKEPLLVEALRFLLQSGLGSTTSQSETYLMNIEGDLFSDLNTSLKQPYSQWLLQTITHLITIVQSQGCI